MNQPIFEACSLRKWFPVRNSILGKTKEFVKAVDNVNLKVYEGEVLGIVGESGCGKSTLIRTMMKLIPCTSGSISFNGTDVTNSHGAMLKDFRRNVQIVFQDPYASLNPRQKVGEMLKEAIELGNKSNLERDDITNNMIQLLNLVGLSADALDKYPHEFSGGQRQRVCIARALAVKPKVLMCDECVSALDVSIQAQIINLLMRLKKEMGLTVIFISHDLRVIRHISDYVAVMYLGKIVEYASNEELFRHPSHPYTKALLSTIPSVHSQAVPKPIVLKGDIPSPIHVPLGCPFHTRCWMAKAECKHIVCKVFDSEKKHFSACPFLKGDSIE